GQPGHAVLGGHVPAESSGGLHPGGGGDVDDGTPTGGEHGGDLVLHRQEHPAQVHRDRFLERAGLQCRHRGHLVSASGAVDGQVQSAEMSHGAFDELSDGAGVAHIGGNGKGLPSGGGDAAGQGVQGLFVPGGQDHVGSGPHELPGRGGADTAAGAGDETDRAVQWTFGHCPVLSLVLARYPQRRRRRLRGSWNAVTTNQISPPKRTTGVRTTSGGKTSMRVLSIPTPAITRPVTASGRGSSRRITDGTETPASNRANGTVNPAEPKPKENVESILATAGSIMGATCAAVQPVSPLK